MKRYSIGLWSGGSSFSFSDIAKLIHSFGDFDAFFVGILAGFLDSAFGGLNDKLLYFGSVWRK